MYSVVIIHQPLYLPHMIKMDKVYILLALNFIGLIFVIGYNIQVDNRVDDYNTKYDNGCKAYNMTYDQNKGINGLYVHIRNETDEIEYYSVWLLGMNVSSVMKTDIHEQCHWLVEHEKEHFCS